MCYVAEAIVAKCNLIAIVYLIQLQSALIASYSRIAIDNRVQGGALTQQQSSDDSRNLAQYNNVQFTRRVNRPCVRPGNS